MGPVEAPRHLVRSAHARRGRPRAARHRRHPRQGGPPRGVARRRVHPLPVRSRHRRGAPAALPGRRAVHQRRHEHALARAARAVLGARRARRSHPVAGVGALLPRAGRSGVGGGAAHRAPRRTGVGHRRRRHGALVRGLRLVRGERDGGGALRLGHRARVAPGRGVVGGRCPTRAPRGAPRSWWRWPGSRRSSARRAPSPRSSSPPRSPSSRASRPCAARALALGAPQRRWSPAASSLGSHRLGAQQHRGRQAAAREPLLRRVRRSPARSLANAQACSSSRCSTARCGRRSSCRTGDGRWPWPGSARWRCWASAQARAVAGRRRPAHRADHVRAVRVLHVPLESPALPVAVRDRLVRRAGLPGAGAGGSRRARCERKWRVLTPILGGVFVGMLATKVRVGPGGRRAVGERDRSPAGGPRALGQAEPTRRARASE